MNDREIRGVDWEFNSWGGFYPSWKNDNQVAEKILKIEGLKRYKCSLVLEGGSIHVDGEGTLITTEECLLNSNRNPHYSKKQIEDLLKRYLNVSKIIWLSKGLYLDDTSGHVDNICCFVKPGMVVLAWTRDKNDPQYERSKDAYERLKFEVDAKGRKLKIYKIYLPDPIYTDKRECKGLTLVNEKRLYSPGKRLCASYVNFYMANGGIIIPSFKDLEYDRKAFDDIQKLFPERQIIQIFARDILLGGGDLHCITLQQPRYKERKEK